MTFVSQSHQKIYPETGQVGISRIGDWRVMQMLEEEAQMGEVQWDASMDSGPSCNE